MKRKNKPIIRKRLKRKYKIILFILVVLLLFAGGNLLKNILPAPSQDDYGKIEETQISDESNTSEELDELGAIIDEADVANEENNFFFKVLDVGQGLSILIKNEDKTMLIDTGYYEYKDKVQEELENNLENNTLNFAISTHSDADHCGSFANVVRNFKVERIIAGDNKSKETSWKKFEEAAKEKNIPIEDDSDLILDMGKDCVVNIYDIADNLDNVNDNSICLVVNFKGIKFLVTGDLTKDLEKKLLSKLPDKIDVVVAGHHGSDTSNSFLPYIDGISYFVVSAGLDNDYHLPSEKVLTAASKCSTYSVGTFRDGDIAFTVENGELCCSATTELDPKDDAGAPSKKKSQK